jgi:RHS repeat-associated protein
MQGRTLGSGTTEGFTSKERDAESQMDDFGARYYLAAVGRWAAADPAPYADRAPQWSPYAYVRDGPVSAFDLLGLLGCSIQNQKDCPKSTAAVSRGALTELSNKAPAISEGILESGKLTAKLAVTGELTVLAVGKFLSVAKGLITSARAVGVVYHGR